MTTTMSSTSSTNIITGPGLYRTANGKEVEIRSISYAAKGGFRGIKRSHDLWQLNGRYTSAPNHPLDIKERIQ